MKPISTLHITVRADHGGGPRHIELLLRYLPTDILSHVASPRQKPFQSRFMELTNGHWFELPFRRFSLTYAHRLASYCRAHDIDLVHSHGTGAGVYGRWLSWQLELPLVHTPHGAGAAHHPFPKSLVFRFFENTTHALIDQLIFVSEGEYEVSRNAGLWPGLDYKVIENGVEPIDLDRVRLWRQQGRERLGLADERPVVVSLSRFDQQKNMEEAYYVARHWPDALFLWIGDGEQKQSLRHRMLIDRVENVLLMNAMDDPLPYLASADLYLSTSLWEGMSLAILEAMSLALPVVASDIPGHRKLVETSGGGKLYLLGQPQQAVSILKSLWADPGLRKKMGKKAQISQKKYYNAASMAQEVARIYRYLLITGSSNKAYLDHGRFDRLDE